MNNFNVRTKSDWRQTVRCEQCGWSKTDFEPAWDHAYETGHEVVLEQVHTRTYNRYRIIGLSYDAEVSDNQ